MKMIFILIKTGANRFSIPSTAPTPMESQKDVIKKLKSTNALHLVLVTSTDSELGLYCPF